MEKDSKIYLAGHRGMVGAAIWRVLKKKGYSNLIGRTSKELDLRNQKAVFDFIKIEKPDVVIDAAARVGGILANNNYPFQFLMENMQIQNNLIDAAHKLDVKKFIFLGSSCIYPKLAPQPLKEEYLLTDSLEPTNDTVVVCPRGKCLGTYRLIPSRGGTKRPNKLDNSSLRFSARSDQKLLLRNPPTPQLLRRAVCDRRRVAWSAQSIPLREIRDSQGPESPPSNEICLQSLSLKF